jgi:diguanylate cyclase (GGDEF)-like protein
MKADPKSKSLHSRNTLASLTAVLDHSEYIKDIVEVAADDLVLVNTALKQEVAGQNASAKVESALKKSEAVEDKVHEAAIELSVVNQALEHEVSERAVLEHELAGAKEQEAAARHAAFHDPLTGLPNRLLFNDRLEHGIAQAKRHGWTLAVMFLDLNDFKSINDSYGHHVGDKVLQVISQRLKENTRDDDTVSRHGGDEFLYLLMEIRNAQDIPMIAEKMINVIQEPCDIGIGKLAISPSIGASIGISVYPKDGVTADELIKSADKAMYRAKRTGSGYMVAR